jgi:hypothetical protein
VLHGIDPQLKLNQVTIDDSFKGRVEFACDVGGVTMACAEQPKEILI